MHNWLNNIKLSADTGVKIDCAYFIILGSVEPTSPSPATTPNVDTTTSFATKPLIVATVAAQCPNPVGVKIGATAFPIVSRIEWLSLENSTNSKFVDIFCKNQITIVACANHYK